MAHLKSSKLTTVNISGTFTIECYPELEFGFIESIDGTFKAYGRHFYTDENGQREDIPVGKESKALFERVISDEQLNALSALTDSTGMTPAQRRRAELITGGKAILTQDGFFGLTGADYEEVIPTPINDEQE
jgi:hypothetical protein